MKWYWISFYRSWCGGPRMGGFKDCGTAERAKENLSQATPQTYHWQGGGWQRSIPPSSGNKPHQMTRSCSGFFMPATRPHRTHWATRTGAGCAAPTRNRIKTSPPRWRLHSTDKIMYSFTKTALHRNRLRVLHHKNFSVLVLYKPPRQPAPLLAFCRSSPTEKSEKKFSLFQFQGSAEDLMGGISD